MILYERFISIYKENSFKKRNDPKITKKQGRDLTLFFARFCVGPPGLDRLFG